MNSLHFSPSMFRPKEKYQKPRDIRSRSERGWGSCLPFLRHLLAYWAGCSYSSSQGSSGKYTNTDKLSFSCLYMDMNQSFREVEKPLLPLGGCQCHLMLMTQKERVKSTTYEWNGKQNITVIFYLTGFCHMLFMILPNEPFRGWASIPATPPIAPSTQGPTGN